MKWLLLMLLIVSGASAADSESEFRLCSGYVLESDLGEKVGGWPVFVKLTEQGAASFAKFSEGNLGKMIRIVVDGRQFARFTIWAQGSDVLRGEFRSKEDARAWQRTLVGELPKTPCGTSEGTNA